MIHKYAPHKQVSLFFCFFFMVALGVFAQVGIGNTNPNANALLEIGDATTTTQGLLLPRVDLVSTTSFAPMAAHLQGMVVYNKNTAGDVTPGYYYNDGGQWVRLAAEVPNDEWSRSGNAGTVAGTNFLGTVDDVSLELFTNNLTRMRVENDGQISLGFGAAPVNSNQQFNVGSTFTNGTAIGGYSGGTGVGIYGQNIGTGYGVFGLNSGGGDGIRAESFDGNGLSIYALDGPILSDNTFFGADGLASFTDDAISNGIWAVNLNSSGTGILGAYDDLSIYPTTGSGVSGSGPRLGIYAYAGAGNATVANRGNAAASFILDTDSNTNTNGTNNGTRAFSKLAGFDNVSPDGTLATANSYYGGYFVGGNLNNGTPSYAYAGIKYNANGNGIYGTNYKIIGNGTNSTLIKDSQGNPRIMFSPEAPEILFQDYGVGKLINGIARIEIDPILKYSLHVDKDHPLKVFVTLEGDCNGVFVTDKSINGFTVKELNGGRSNVSFSWQIVANRADEKDASGSIVSKHVGLRLPIGPGQLQVTEAQIKGKDKKYDRKGISNEKSENTKAEETSTIIVVDQSTKPKSKTSG